MDARLLELERAYRAAPDDAALGLELGWACLRAGRARDAVLLGRAAGHEPLREAAARLLAERAGLAFVGLSPRGERLARGEHELALVPGGAVLDEGGEAWASSLALRGSRADLRRVVVPDLLVGVEPRPAETRADARAAAAALGGRLPRPEEWKKAWRGGLFLDGDWLARDPNAAPDRLAPWGLEDPPDELGRRAGITLQSTYGITFHLDGCEWCEGPGELGLRLDPDGGRYHVALATAAERRGRSLEWRLVVEGGQMM